MIERVLASFISGALLGLVGTTIQATTHNPLASTATLGISGLAVGVVLLSQALVTFFPTFFSSLVIPGLLILFGFILLISLAFRRWQTAGPKRFGREIEIQKQGPILLGITFNLGIGALFALMQFIFLSLNWEFPHDLWFGNFKFARMSQLLPLGLCLLFFLIWARIAKADLEVMIYGPELAMNLRIPWRRRMLQAFLLALAAETIICLQFGVFGLASLVFPLLWRSWPMVGGTLGKEMFWGTILSGLFMTSLDLLCYQFPILGSEIPVGLLVMLAGSVGLVLSLWKTHLAKRV